MMQMAGISSSQRSKHHELFQAITERHERNIQKMKSVMVECNPFQQEDPFLKNFVTKAVMPEPVKRLKTRYIAEHNCWPRVLQHICQGANCWCKKSLGQNEQGETVDVDGCLKNCEDQPTNEGHRAETNTVSLCTTADNCTHT